MHFVEAKGILTGRAGMQGMNVYRGCSHGCIYCDSRSRCYQFTHPFEDIEVKQNAPALLAQALRARRKPCMIGTGSMSDPYMPCEETLGLTRRCLEIIRQYGFGATVITKSDRVLRDIDLLEAINSETKSVVHPAVVWLTPILPFINDTEENILPILHACADIGVRGIICFDMGMTLREGNREYYYAALDRHFPGLKERYIERFGNAYHVPSPNSRALMRLFRDFCKERGILHDPDECFSYLAELPDRSPQLSLFDPPR